MELDQPTKPRLPGAPRFWVEITKERIEDSIKRDSAHCMISEAIAAQRPDMADVITDLQTIRFSNRQKRVRFIYLTPRTVQAALVHFDDGVTVVEPFRFFLRGAQVIRMKKERTPRETRKPREQAQLRFEKGRQHPPVKKGGHAPPVNARFVRRQYGLRLLTR